MSGVAYTPPVSQAQMDLVGQALATKANASAVPQPATDAPPAVALNSDPGAATGFARADHTHQSRLQAKRVQLTLTGGQADYSFPLAYDAGVVPIVEVMAETPTGAAYKLDAFIVQGSTTNTKTTIGVTKLNQSVVTGLLNAVLPVFAAATGQVWVNIMSRAPS